VPDQLARRSRPGGKKEIAHSGENMVIASPPLSS
jgi:hypothetical protein